MVVGNCASVVHVSSPAAAAVAQSTAVCSGVCCWQLSNHGVRVCAVGLGSIRGCNGRWMPITVANQQSVNCVQVHPASTNLQEVQ